MLYTVDTPFKNLFSIPESMKPMEILYYIRNIPEYTLYGNNFSPSQRYSYIVYALYYSVTSVIRTRLIRTSIYRNSGPYNGFN